MTTYTPAVITTGVDSKGNLFSFWKNYENMWVDGYNECVVTADFIRAHVYPKVQKIYFSDFVMTGEDWVEAGCPLWLTSEQIELLKTGDGSVVEMAMVTEKSIDAILDVPVVENTKTEREKFLELVAAHNAKVTKWTKKDNCQHEKTYAVIKGIFCRDCHETIEPRNDFEKRLVSRLNYKGNWYVNYQFRP